MHLVEIKFALLEPCTIFKLSTATTEGNTMNTNRSTTLGSKKALKKFGPRKGHAVYNGLKRSNRQRALMRAAAIPAEKMSTAFKRMTKAAGRMAEDFHEFTKFLQHGPTAPEMSLQDHLAQPLAGHYSNAMWAFYKEPKGNPGVGVSELTTLAQQYAYLHPNK